MLPPGFPTLLRRRLLRLIGYVMEGGAPRPAPDLLLLRRRRGHRPQAVGRARPQVRRGDVQGRFGRTVPALRRCRLHSSRRAGRLGPARRPRHDSAAGPSGGHPDRFERRGGHRGRRRGPQPVTSRTPCAQPEVPTPKWCCWRSTPSPRHARRRFTGWLTLEHTQDGDSPRAAARSWTALTDAAAVLARPVSPASPRSTTTHF